MFGTTIHGLISEIVAHRVMLPAMQRPFVWEEARIISLIDSLLRDFPLGSVMLWKSGAVQRYRPFKVHVRDDEDEVFQFEQGDANPRYLVLDGQQRLTSLLVATQGTYNGRKFFLNVLSGKTEHKDPGEIYYEGHFFTSKEAACMNANAGSPPQRHFVALGELTNVNPPQANLLAAKKGKELQLSDSEAERLNDTYLRAASVMGNHKALQVIFIGESPGDDKNVDEVLEIFFRVNSGGLVLQKSDLLMSLLDIHWNDIQPELMATVREVNKAKPYEFTRDDVLKSLLLFLGAETRFDRLVADRDRVAALARQMEPVLPTAREAWKLLAVILTDDCKIYSERFFRGGHNALLPFAVWLCRNPKPTPGQRNALRIGIHVAIMSGVFASAEARMGRFVRDQVSEGDFPLKPLGNR